MWKSFWHNVGIILLTLFCAIGCVAALGFVATTFWMGVAAFVLAETATKWIILIIAFIIIIFALAFYYAWRDHRQY